MHSATEVMYSHPLSAQFLPLSTGFTWYWSASSPDGAAPPGAGSAASGAATVQVYVQLHLCSVLALYFIALQVLQSSTSSNTLLFSAAHVASSPQSAREHSTVEAGASR